MTPKILFFACPLNRLLWLSLCLSVFLPACLSLDQQSSYGLHSVQTLPSKLWLELLHGLALTIHEPDLV